MKHACTGTLLITGFLLPLPCLAQSANASSFKEKAELAVLSAIVGGVAGFFSTGIKLWQERASKKKEILEMMEPEIEKQSKMMEITLEAKIKELRLQIKIKEETDKEQEVIKWRLHYLDPLYAATRELKDRMGLLHYKTEHLDECEQMKNWFSLVHKVGTRQGASEADKNWFALWCNGEGNFAMTSLYKTVVYLAYARNIVMQASYVVVTKDYFANLEDRLLQVSNALGGEYNIWKESQQSIGYVAWHEGEVMSYRDFCLSLANEAQGPWYLRLMDFYRDAHLKAEDFLNIQNALLDLEKQIVAISQSKFTTQSGN